MKLSGTSVLFDICLHCPLVLIWTDTPEHLLFHVMGNKLSLNAQVLPAPRLRGVRTCSSELSSWPFLMCSFNTVKKSPLAKYRIFCLYANLITRIGITLKDRKSTNAEMMKGFVSDFSVLCHLYRHLTLCRVNVRILPSWDGSHSLPFKKV